MDDEDDTSAAKQARYEAKRREHIANPPEIVIPPEQAYWVITRGFKFAEEKDAK